MSIKSLFCSITALVASSMGISLGAINSLKNLPLILSYPSPKQKDILLETLNIWRSLQQPTRTRDLCIRRLHKFRGRTIRWSWIKELNMSFTAIPEKTPLPRRLLFRLRIAPDYKQSILFQVWEYLPRLQKEGRFLVPLFLFWQR